jgi:uncharacterized protein (TIGR00251 family)
MTIAVRSLARGVRFDVRVQPRASRSEVAGEQEGALRVRLAAPPVNGAANEALVELLADLLRVARRNVRIVSGAASRRKAVEVDGVTAGQVIALSEDAP